MDVDGLIDKVAGFDPYVGGMLRLIRAFGLRKREAIMLRPNECVVNFADTGLPLTEKQGEEYVWIRQGAKGGRPPSLSMKVPMNTPRRRQAVASTQRIAFWDGHAHTDAPGGVKRPPETSLDVLHLNFECEAKWLSCSHICSLPAQTPHGIPHRSCMQRLAGALRGRCVQRLNCSL